MCLRSCTLYVFLCIWVLSFFCFFAPFQSKFSKFLSGGRGRGWKKTKRLLSCLVDCDTVLSLPFSLFFSAFFILLLGNFLSGRHLALGSISAAVSESFLCLYAQQLLASRCRSHYSQSWFVPFLHAIRFSPYFPRKSAWVRPLLHQRLNWRPLLVYVSLKQSHGWAAPDAHIRQAGRRGWWRAGRGSAG